MAWVKLDDHFPEHPKMLSLGPHLPLAGWLSVAALAWSNRHLTDGFIPDHVLSLLWHFGDVVGTGFIAESHGETSAEFFPSDGAFLAERLVDAGLWDRDEDKKGYWIHDYLEYQPSKRKVELVRKKRSYAGRVGGSKTQAQAKQSASGLLDGGLTSVRDNVEAKLNPDPDPDPGTRKKTKGRKMRGPAAPAACRPFAEFWESWPPGHRVGMKQAEGQWDRLTDEQRELATADVRMRREKSILWQGPASDGRWAIPHPFRYLRDHRWNDAPPGGRVGLTVVAPKMDRYWCRHEPRCASVEWHKIQLEKGVKETVQIEE